MNKKRIFLVAVAICCLALAGTGTMAYFTARETAYNVITTGTLDMELVETSTDADGNVIPFPEEGVDNVMPGMAIDKVVTVKNTGGVDFYTRVKVTCLLTDADGETDTLDLSMFEIDFDETNWTLGEDGYYYYHRALAPVAMADDGSGGVELTVDETEPLFTTVTLKTAMDNAYQNATLEILVDAEAVQSRNNTDSPLTAVWN